MSQQPPEQPTTITISEGAGRALASRLLRRAARAGQQLAQQRGQELLHEAQARLGQARQWVMEPAHVERAQEFLARAASWGMRLGFEHDPKAALLFEFVSWIEREHGKGAVLVCLAQHNPVIDGTLLDLIQTRYMTWPKVDEQAYQRKLDAVSHTLLGLLCALAQVADRQPGPVVRTREALVERFVSSPALPERFGALARMAAGDEATLRAHAKPEEPASRGAQEGEQEARWMSRRGLGRLARRLRPSASEPQSRIVPEDRASALTSHRPLQDDPHFQFVVNSYVFFVQTTMARAMVEQLPLLLTATVGRGISAQDEAEEPYSSPEDQPKSSRGAEAARPADGVVIDMG